MKKIKKDYMNKIYVFGLPFIITILAMLIAILKYPLTEINYHNSDATWHTLLTIESYNETPISKHLFLPIVSLGQDTDKGIQWGSTIPDKAGNYYYTSFSAAGYFAPWLFFKIFHLPVCESSLYIFNSVLFMVSACLWCVFLIWIYKENKNAKLIPAIGAILYIFAPEILHGMGIVYWQQSLMQVTLLIQIMGYYKYRESNSKKGKIIFYIFSFLNPYIEWTGYIANIGFGIVEFVTNYKKQPKKALKEVLILGGITLFSFLFFILHYLLRVNIILFFQYLNTSFIARSVEVPVEITSVLGGYLKSFLYIWIFLLILTIWNIAISKKLEFFKGSLMFILAFPILENIIVKHHALLYSYDKMKGGFLIIFLCCELIYQILKRENNKRTSQILIVITIFTAFLNFKSYKNDSFYMWSTNYRQDNVILANYINEKYPANLAILSSEYDVRGYLNLLFKRGMYEYADLNKILPVAKEKMSQYIVVLTVEDEDIVGVIDLSGAIVYDIKNHIASNITVNNGIIEETSYVDKSDYSFPTIFNSIANENELILNREENLLLKLFLTDKIYLDENDFTIQKVNYDTNLIFITLNRNISEYTTTSTFRIGTEENS